MLQHLRVHIHALAMLLGLMICLTMTASAVSVPEDHWAAAELGWAVETGIFRTDMQVSLVNDGPVTILLDSEKNF